MELDDLPSTLLPYSDEPTKAESLVVGLPMRYIVAFPADTVSQVRKVRFNLTLCLGCSRPRPCVAR